MLVLVLEGQETPRSSGAEPEHAEWTHGVFLDAAAAEEAARELERCRVFGALD